MVKTVYVYLFFLLPGFFISPEVRGQAYDTLTLPECFRLATERFPLIAGKQILKKQISLEDKNLKSAFYPEMNLNAGATYYSDVVALHSFIQSHNINDSPSLLIQVFTAEMW